MQRLPFIGAFESTYLPDHDVDVAETTGHIDRRMDDLSLLRGCGVETLRYPIRWHRVQPRPGTFDWADTDLAMDQLRELGLSPIVDLVHHTSYPRWLRYGFADEGFGDAYVAFVEAFAERYGWVQHYTLFNEPLATLLLCAHEGVWPPRGIGMDSFVRMLENALPAISRAHEVTTAMLPHARHVWADTCEGHTGTPGTAGAEYADYANDRRFFVLDALLGRLGDVREGERPFVDDVLAHGGRSLLELTPLGIDVLGLDYYAHSQWHFGPHRGIAPSPHPAPMADLIEEYATRYSLPCMLTETNIRGFASDRATWLKYTLEQCEIAIRRGVDLRGYCWFPVVDSCDWSSLLTRHEGAIDPVGVFPIDAAGNRLPSSMSRAYTEAAHGAAAASLPAYELQEPVRSWLAGYAPHMSHWTWEAPPAHEVMTPGPETDVSRGYDPLGGHLR